MLKKFNYEAHTDSYWVNMTQNELKLLSALLYRIRLGAGNDFKEAAKNLSTGMDDVTDDVWRDEAAAEVGLWFSLTDEDGTIGAYLDSAYASIEVRGGQQLTTAEMAAPYFVMP